MKPSKSLLLSMLLILINYYYMSPSVAENRMNAKQPKASSEQIVDTAILSSIKPEKSTAVFYGTNLPSEILSQYGRIIVESDNVKKEELKALTSKGSKVYAYVSIGEISPTRKWFSKIKKEWILGENKVWDSKVMDLTSQGWQDFIVDSIVKPLWDAGYRGLFLDTMDSFYLYAKNEEQRKAQAGALVKLLKRIHKKYPEIHFISNRGFEVIASIGDQLEAVLAESLFSSWDNVNKVYKETSKNDQEWLITKLNDIKNKLSIDIIVIDYMSPSEPNKMSRLATKITQEGFIPWVSIASLDIVGLGSLQIKPNTHLLLTDSATKINISSLAKKYKNYFTALKTKGEKIKVHDIQSGLPIGHMVRRYIDILTTLPLKKQSNAYKKWVKEQIEEGANIIPLSVSAK